MENSCGCNVSSADVSLFSKNDDDDLFPDYPIPNHFTLINLSGCMGFAKLDDVTPCTPKPPVLTFCQNFMMGMIGNDANRLLTFSDINTNFVKLTTVILWHSGITDLSIFSLLTNLSVLSLTGCYTITQLDGIQHSKQLTEFYIKHCALLVSLKGIELVEKLIKLSVICCDNLKYIPENIICLTNLDDITLTECGSLPKSFTELYCLRNKKNLVFRVLKDMLSNNTSSWTRCDHENFGSDVNKLFATALLGIQRLDSVGIDPEAIEAMFEEFLQCYRYLI